MLYLLCFFSLFPHFFPLHFQFLALVAVVLSLLFLKWALDWLPLLRDTSQLASGLSRGTEVYPRGGDSRTPIGGCCCSVEFQQVSRAGKQTDSSTRQCWQAVCSGGFGALKLSFQDGMLTRPLQVLVFGLTPGFSGFLWHFGRAGLWRLSCTGFDSFLDAAASWIHPLGSHFAA